VVEESEEEEDPPSVKSWTHKTKEYYKACDENCEEDNCDCTGVVYEMETEDPLGTWNGTEIVPLAEEED